MSAEIGKPLKRREGRAKITGQAQYTGDIQLPGLVHAVVVQSAIASGRVLDIDTSQAEAAPGFLAAITHRNRPKLNPCRVMLETDETGNMQACGAGEQRLPLDGDRVFYSGQHLAVIVAGTLEQARHAASLVRVRYREARPVITFADALPSAFTPKDVWKQPADTVSGDVAKGMGAAQYQLQETYFTALQHHNTMEPHATIAVWYDGKLTLYEPSTWVYGVRKAAATWFGLEEDDVHVVQHFVGGSFGCKGPTWNHVALAALAARQVGRPVKLTLTRRQEFTGVGYRPPIRHEIQLGAGSDGKLTALAHHAIAQSSMFETRAVAPVTKTSRKIYECPNVATTYRLLHSNLPAPFTMRGPGETPGLFALESAMDELAYQAGIDPIELRLRNYAEMDPEERKRWSSKSLRECYRQGAERFGWNGRNPKPRSMRAGEWLIGWGMSTMAYDAKMVPATARARIYADGRVRVQSATCDQGTGSYTIMSQIAADTLGVSMDAIRFELGDTYLPVAPISAGSQTASSVGTAVKAASDSLRKQLLAAALADAASPLRGHPEADIAANDGAFFLRSNPEMRQTFQEVLQHAGQDWMEATESIKPSEEYEKFTCYSFGAHFAEVRVREATGEPRVTRYVGAFAAGKILNQRTAHSQLTGGIVWGIGMALMEQTVYDPRRGRIVNSNLAQYHVPVNADIPDIEAFFIDEEDPYVDALGVKGVGEIGTVGAAAAIANAVFHATGKRIRDLPITPEKLI